MVETLARARWATVTFAAGALAGGAITFGGLARLGDALGAGGGAAAAVAIAALLTCAFGDAAGRRIVPQVRRQVPESWRRILPVPAAAALYGVLLGLGFTTFLLTFATWALAAACLAVGTPATGLAVGLAFGAGRAVPVAALAAREDGAAAIAARPDLLLGLRRAVAAALVAAAALLAAAPPAARAEDTFTDPGSNPSAAAGTVAWQNGATGYLLRAGETQPVAVPGTHPAVAAGRLAYATTDGVTVANALTFAPQLAVPAPGVDAVGLSDQIVTWRAPDATGRDVVYAKALTPEAAVVTVATARDSGSLGRPSADGTHVVFDSQSPTASRILDRDVATGVLAVLRRARTGDGLLLAPDVDAGRLVYVRSTARRQQVRLGAAIPDAADRTIFATTPTARRDKGYEDGKHEHHAGYPDGKRPVLPPAPPYGLTVTLWNTALDGTTAYVTRVRHRAGGVTQSRILRLPAARKR
jgi:hypothetical protein